MSIEFTISNHYLRSNKKSFVASTSAMSMAGLAIAIMSLITVLSVINGFHKELREKVLNAISHAYISEYTDTLSNWKEVQKDIDKHKKVLASSPYIEHYALISANDKFHGISLRGAILKEEAKTSTILNKIKYGKQDLSMSSILIGSGLALRLGVFVGTEIVILTPKQSLITKTNIIPQFKNFTISGIFDAGINEYDNDLAFISLEQAQNLYSMQDLVSGIHLKVDDLFEAKTITSEVVDSLGGDNYYGIDWSVQKSNFIQALNLEKQMIAVLLSLIIIIAIFNIVSMMMVVVNTKKADIAILRTMGMTSKRIVKIFFYQGLTIGLIGIIIGVILGIILALNIENIISAIEFILGFKFFPEGVFYINRFPAEIKIIDIINIVAGALILIIVAAIYPAIKASRINIAKVLSNE